MLEQSVQDLQNDLVKMRQASAQVMASTKQLEKRAEAAESSSQEWYVLFYSDCGRLHLISLSLSFALRR